MWFTLHKFLGTQTELVQSTEIKAPKWYFYNSAEILPERQKTDRQNDDSAEKMTVIALLESFY